MSTSSRARRVLNVTLGALLLLSACDDVGGPLAPDSPESAALRRRPGRTPRPVPVDSAPTPVPPDTTTPPPPPPDTTAPNPGPTGPTTEPVFPGNGSLLWSDDFSAHTDDAALLSRYATMSGESGVHLDQSAGIGGSRAMRVDWRARSGCTDDGHLIEASFPSAQREVVVQYSVRYAAGFVFDWIGRGGPCSGNAKKLFFLWAGAGSRFDFISENHALGMGSDHDHPLQNPNLNGGFTPEQLGDGNWHRITIRVRQSSTPTATDGAISGWVDGVQKWSVPAWASQSSGGWVLFKLPTTFNQGSPVDQSEWVDGLRIWTP